MTSKEQFNSVSHIIAQIKACCEIGDLNEAYNLIVVLDNKEIVLDIYDEMKLTLYKGIIMLRRGEYKIAEESMLRSLALAGSYSDARLRYNRYDNLVALYITTKQVHHAIDYLKKSMDLKEAEGRQIDVARSQLQLASLMFSVDDFESGIEALQKANVLISALDDIDIKIQYLFSYILQLKWEKNYEEYLKANDMILTYAEKVNDPYIACRAYMNQGELLVVLDQYNAGKEKYQNALNIAIGNHLGVEELFIYVQLSKIALRQSDILKCRELYNYILSHKDLSEDDAIQEEIAELGSRLFEAEGNMKAAMQTGRRYMELYKKHYDNEQTRTVLYIKARYEIEKKERELQETKLKQVESELKAVKAEKELIKSEKRFRAWVENGTDMIVILDREFRPVYASPFVFKALGYEKDELIDVPLADFIHPEDVDSAMINLGISSQSPKVAIHAQFRLPQKDGPYKWIEGTITNLLDDDIVEGIVCNLKDITERKQSEEAIQDLNKSLEIKIADRTQELQEAVKDLEAFSYSVSHDLRSPLRIITGYAKLLLSDQDFHLNGEAKEFIDTILDNSERMGQLIDDLLNFSRMGRKALYKSPADLNAMVNAIITDVRKTDATITKDITIDYLTPAHCDIALIKQVWINLISNAIKYSSKKSRPVIEIGCMDKLNETIYYVKDNGAGFDMRFAKNLFGVFKRLHDRAEFDGMGVGLALAQRIVRMHEGRIWAEAEVGKGATFYFTLGKEE